MTIWVSKSADFYADFKSKEDWINFFRVLNFHFFGFEKQQEILPFSYPY